MFPRSRDEQAPQFTALGDGAVIRITGDFGTDYCFLPTKETEVTVGDVSFRGIAGSVQDRAGIRVLATGAAGEVRAGPWGLSAPQAASLRVETGRLVVHLPYAQKTGGEVTLRTAGQWKPAAGQAGITVTTVEGDSRVVVPAGVVQAVLEQL
jgi:hypothetical protein